MKIKIRIFLLISAGIIAIFLIVAAMQTKYHEKRSLNELRTRAKSVAEVAAISARILIMDGRSGKVGELIAGFEGKTRTQGCIIYDSACKVMAESRTFKDASIVDSQKVKSIMDGKPAEFIEAYDDGYEVLKYMEPIMNDKTALGAVEVIYDMSYINTGIYKSWKRLGVLAVFFIVLISLFAFDFIEKTFFLPEKKVREMIENLKNRRITDKFGILKGFNVLMDNFEDSSIVKTFIDEKAGLKNYRFYKDVLAPVLESGREICLAIIDIDDFKRVNTDFGHDAGDKVIKAVSNILSGHTNEACRYGGEEFVFIAKGDMVSFFTLCDRIREDIEKEAASAAGINRSITVSIGAATDLDAEMIYEGEKERAIFRMADKRLMRAKETGKNSVVARG